MSTTSPERNRDDRLQLLAYMMPAVPLAFLGLPLYVYLPAHYAEISGIGLAGVGLILLLARLLDLFTDPLVGYLNDRVRPYLAPQWLMALGGVLLMGGAWWLFRPPGEVGATYLFVSLTITYLGWTLLAIPYYSLGAEVGVHAGQARVAAWREAGMIAGTLAALLLPVLVVGGGLGVAAWGLWLLVPLALLASSLVRAPGGPDLRTVGALLAMWRDTSRPARQVLGIHLLNTLAGGTAATLFVIYTQQALGLDLRAGGLLLLLYFASGLLALPLWMRIARRMGEVRAWQMAMLFAAIGFLPAAFLGAGDGLWFALVCMATGATLGADIALPAALQARLVVSESRVLQRPRGGALFGLWGMAGKFALALSAGLSLPLLDLFSSLGADGSRAAAVPWLYAGLPVLIKLLAVAALRYSSLDDEAALQRGGPEVHDVDYKSPAAGADPVTPGRV